MKLNLSLAGLILSVVLLGALIYGAIFLKDEIDIVYLLVIVVILILALVSTMIVKFFPNSNFAKKLSNLIDKVVDELQFS